MALSFKGKTVVVTGGGGSIGRAYALAYAQRGANVVVNDLSEEAADRVVQEITAAGGKAVKDTHTVLDGPAIVRTALDAYDSVHVLINNAGNVSLTTLENFTDEQWDAFVDVHLKGTISCTLAVWPLFCTQRTGYIINAISSAGLYGSIDNPAYGSAKAGIIAFTKAVAKEGAHFGIKANAVAPLADSPMLKLALPEEIRKNISPDFIPPLGLALTHPERSPDVTGKLFECAAGWIAEIKSARTKGVLFRADKPLTPATVQERWSDIAPGFAEHASRDANDLRSEGQTVLITGATTDLGRAYARVFASLGANLVLNDSDDVAVNTLVQSIVKDGGKAVAAVAPAEDADAIVQAAVKAYGTIHALVTNADVSPAFVLPQLTDRHWDETIRAHLRAAYKIAKACWPIFRNQKYGRVVLTSSSAGLNGAESKVPFSCAKGAVIGFGRAIADDGKPNKILVNVVLPSDGKQLDSTSVSAVVAFLASKANVGATGSLIEVSGSWVGQSQWQRAGGHGFYHDEKLTPEAVIAQWERITDFDDGRATNPSSVKDSFEAVRKVLQRAGLAPLIPIMLDDGQLQQHFD